jgi:CRISP-associated protein Cas1
MGHLADSAFSEVELRQAWSNVLGNDLEDGALSQGVSRFQEDWEQHLLVLHQNLADGTYKPRPLTEVAIHDGDGDTRLLHVPAVRDRIVARSILQPITLVVNPVLGPASYAYRPGLGVTDGIQALVACREEGLAWVLRTDVDQRFPSVPVGLARRMLGALVRDDDLLAVVDLLLARPFTRAGAGRRIMRGLPQGCPLSPLLANLVLAQVDAALLNEGFAVIRYADDLAVATRSEADAGEAARCAHPAVEEVGMSLGADKTEAMSFAEGFCFLGEDFGPRYPPPLLDHRVEDPDRRVVYVALQGGRVRTQAGRLIIRVGG